MRRAPALPLLLSALAWVCLGAATPSHSTECRADGHCGDAGCLMKGALQAPLDGCAGDICPSDPLSLVQVGASSLARRSSAAAGSSVAANASAAVAANASLASNTSLASGAGLASDSRIWGAARLTASTASSATANQVAASLQQVEVAQGDFTQGLIFTMLAVIIVIGIYLLLCTEIRPGEVDLHDSKSRARPSMYSQQGQWPPSLASQKGGLPARQPPVRGSDRLLPPFAGNTGGTENTWGRPSEFPVGPAGGSSLAALQSRRDARWDEWHPELPKVYPNLVIPNSHTRLAVPYDALSCPGFEIDVLGMSGVPLLCASLVDGPGPRSIEISLHSVGKLLAIVDEPGGGPSGSGIEIRAADPPRVIGQLIRDEHLRPEGPQYTLRDFEGRPFLIIGCSNFQDGRSWKVRSMVNGTLTERATAVQRPPGRLPAEHYEVVANKNVDAVLILACLLGVVVFEAPLRPGSTVPPPSGRQSMFQTERLSLPQFTG